MALGKYSARCFRLKNKTGLGGPLYSRLALPSDRYATALWPKLSVSWQDAA